jgi:4-amino-4-deoxy-L-arabinose transferase
MAMPLGGHSATFLSLALAVLLFVWPLTVRFPLLDPDEGLHGAIAQEMLERGEYITPTFLGQAFFDKPILFFWAQIGSLRVLGSTEAGVRLPGLLFGALGAVTTALLARELCGGFAGLLAGVLYATMLLPIAQAQAGVHDIALVPWTNLALLFLRRADTAVRRRAVVGALALVALCLGLAILTKGLAGVALVVAAAVAVLIVTRRLTVTRAMSIASCVCMAAIIAAPWYLAMERTHPGYLHYYFIDRHVLGYVAGSARHADQPWWYYGPIVFAGGFPWILDLMAGALDRRWEADDPSTAATSLAVWTWLSSGLLFLSVAQVKLWTYALPLFPAVAILAAVFWARELQRRPHTPSRYIMWAITAHVILGSLLLPAAMLFSRVRYGVAPSLTLHAVAAVIAVGYWRARTAWTRGHSVVGFGAMVTLLVVTVMAVLALVMPTVAETLSERDIARHFNHIGRMPARLWLVDDRVGSLMFYLDPTVRADLTSARVRSVGMNVVRTRIDEAPPDTIVAVRERRVDRFISVMALRPVAYDRAGQFRLYKAALLQRACCTVNGH